MAVTPIQASEIEVGRQGNRVFYDADGSMCFSDRFVTKVRLIELLQHSGGGSNTKIVSVADTSWQLDHHDNVYNRDFWNVEFLLTALTIPNNTTLTVTGLIVVSQVPLITEEVSFDEIQLFSNKLKVISSEKINCFLVIEPA
jgi:hypothetical protein